MPKRILATLVAAALLNAQIMALPALADNQMNYTLLPASQASQLPRGGGVLGMDVGRSQQITSGGLTFELLKVNSVRPSSPAALAGFKGGDQIIAVDGRVFPTVAAFAGYVGSKSVGTQISIDSMPATGGPQEAQRTTVTMGGGTAATAQPVQVPSQPATSTGLSTGTKVAIGIGAAALFGCYKFGCFRKRTPVMTPR